RGPNRDGCGPARSFFVGGVLTNERSESPPPLDAGWLRAHRHPSSDLLLPQDRSQRVPVPRRSLRTLWPPEEREVEPIPAGGMRTFPFTGSRPSRELHNRVAPGGITLGDQRR